MRFQSDRIKLTNDKLNNQVTTKKLFINLKNHLKKIAGVIG